MAEGTYEYECMRAELLGIEKPDYDEFMKKKQQQPEDDEEEQEIETLKTVDLETEQAKNISGGLEELNSILAVTQKKINRFKASCGSLTNLLKIKIGSVSSVDSADDSNGKTNGSQGQVADSDEPTAATNGSCGGGPRKSDLAKALDNHVDSLDAMLDKADNAYHSMSHQNQQIKKFLK